MTLRTMRILRDFSQEELAERLGVSTQSVSNWESGRNLPKPPQIKRMAQIFGASETDILVACWEGYANDKKRSTGNPRRSPSKVRVDS